MSRWIFYTNTFCLQFLKHFSVPDVASVIMPLVHIVSFVVSVSVTVPDDAVHNTVDFVFICVSGAFTHTFCDILSQTIFISFSYHIYLSYVLFIRLSAVCGSHYENHLLFLIFSPILH